MIRAVLFDLGNVIVPVDFRRCHEALGSTGPGTGAWNHPLGVSVAADERSLTGLHLRAALERRHQLAAAR